MGRLGWGVVCQVRVVEGGVRVARGWIEGIFSYSFFSFGGLLRRCGFVVVIGWGFFSGASLCLCADKDCATRQFESAA